MFSEINEKMKKRMEYLENIDKNDRLDGTERMKRLRQIPSETGKFIALLASTCPNGNYLEIGTSAGYSAMWLSLAIKDRKLKLKTYELLEEKIKLAKETFNASDINDLVELIEGDALKNIYKEDNIAFCFIDCEKEMYGKCWDIISGKILKNGIIIADNAINHYDTIKPMIDKALNDIRFDSLIVPIGKGELISKRK